MISIIIACLALAFSVFSYVTHDRKLKEQEQLLNEINLSEAQERRLNKKKAKIRGFIAYLGNGKNDLVIINEGESEALSVHIDILNNSDQGCLWQEKELFVPQISPGGTFVFHFSTIDGASSVIHFCYSWKDSFSINNQYKECLQRRK